MSVKPSYRITGQIVDRKQGRGIGGFTIYAWDKDILTRDELLGSAVTDSEGRFEIAFEWPKVRTLWTLWEDIIDWRPDLYFEMYFHAKSVSDFDVVYPDIAQPFPSHSVRWNVPGDAMDIKVKLDDPTPKTAPEIYTIKGTLLSSINGKGIERLRLEGWDKDALIDDRLGSAVTDDKGQFEVEFDERYYQEICFERRPDVYFKVFSGKGLIRSTEDSVLWNVDQWPRQVAISVDLLPGKVDGPTPPNKLYSAHMIKRMGEERFVDKYEKTIGTPQARLVYANAEKIAGFALLALAKYAWDTNAITPYAIPKTNLAANPNETVRPTLEELFGNLDFCHCEHCRSVLGPAAYLVDLLMFLNNATAIDGETGLEKLFARRPDLGNIELSCENTNTVLPYIDLVNEALENTIAAHLSEADTRRYHRLCGRGVPDLGETKGVSARSPGTPQSKGVRRTQQVDNGLPLDAAVQPLGGRGARVSGAARGDTP